MTKIKEVGEVSVYVNGEGRFIAEVGGRVINKPSLREIEKELGKIAGGIAVFYFGSEFQLVQYELIGVEPKGGFRDKSGRKRAAYETYYKSTPELIAEAEDLARRYEAAISEFRKERYAILDRAKRITEKDFQPPAPASAQSEGQ